MKTKLLIPIFALIAGTVSRAVEVSAEARKLLGIETVVLTDKTLPPEVAAYGSVLSPAALVDLIRQIAAAQATSGISKESLERSEKLFSSGELVARKDVQAAQVLHAADQVSLQALEDRLVLEWGPAFSILSPPDRGKLLGDLLAGRQALLRITVSRGEKWETSPQAARLYSLGSELAPFRCERLMAAPSIDPAFQGQAFLGLIETSARPLPAGLALTGVLELKGQESLVGKFIPQDSVVFYLGKTWIYLKADGDDFERREISIHAPVEGGWFVKLDVTKPQETVIKGAQSLLSQETLAPAVEED